MGTVPEAWCWRAAVPMQVGSFVVMAVGDRGKPGEEPTLGEQKLLKAQEKGVTTVVSDSVSAQVAEVEAFEFVELSPSQGEPSTAPE